MRNFQRHTETFFFNSREVSENKFTNYIHIYLADIYKYIMISLVLPHIFLCQKKSWKQDSKEQENVVPASNFVGSQT